MIINRLSKGFVIIRNVFGNKYGLIVFVFVGCTSKRNSIKGKWESEPQYDYENKIVYIFTDDKYQVFINGEEYESSLPYIIQGDSIFLDRGEHWIPIVGRQNRYIKESYSISKEDEDTFLHMGGLVLRKAD